jgi:tRNA/rRNA methyltransferase
MRALLNTKVVLVRPLYGGNVGSVCRAMMNMGLSQLVIAEPRTPFNAHDAMKWSLNARPIWEQRQEFATLQEAVADCSLVAGTTGREGLYTSHVRTPREWAPLLLEAASNGPIALVFGPEDNGLSNEDLEVCTQLIRIPSTDEYSSLNLSHAVMVCAYELYVASSTFQPAGERSVDATGEMRERMFDMWRDALLTIGFMKEDKADHMMLALRRIFNRGKLTEIDARILMGIAHQAAWAARKE